MKSTALATALAASVFAGLIGAASSAQADPLNPRDPDYCGNSPDILLCNDQKSTYPSPAEMAYLDSIRGLFPPGTEARRLAAGRTACLEFPKYPKSLSTEQTSAYLQITRPTAETVVAAAHSNICPSLVQQG